MAISVDGASRTSSTLGVERPQDTGNEQKVEEQVRPGYEKSKEELKGMDDLLAKEEQKDPGNQKIKDARADLKELDKATDDVFNSTLNLAKAKDGGDPEAIEKAQGASFDAQQNFGEKYDKLSGSLEALTGQPLPPLQQ